ncbi:hypothetical protein NUW54_g9785 [Trametes sanguinea]|uniref:Uncharacterized protein n=1 Tax=Trametes sanguinea TaxID=158606 RepID=A0ACC1P4B3_9APHY|nr:hypothetical protein NUW54_g9785 [Trametes sanguinea]
MPHQTREADADADAVQREEEARPNKASPSAISHTAPRATAPRAGPGRARGTERESKGGYARSRRSRASRTAAVLVRGVSAVMRSISIHGIRVIEGRSKELRSLGTHRGKAQHVHDIREICHENL